MARTACSLALWSGFVFGGMQVWSTFRPETAEQFVAYQTPITRPTIQPRNVVQDSVRTTAAVLNAASPAALETLKAE